MYVISNILLYPLINKNAYISRIKRDNIELSKLRVSFYLVSIVSTILAIMFFAVNNANLDSFGQTSSTNFTITAVGDIGCNENAKKTFSTITDQKPNLTLLLGDLAYVNLFDDEDDNNSIDCIVKMTNALANQSKVIVALGNRDISSQYVNIDTKQNYLKVYDIPDEGFYQRNFDNGQITIIVMNYTGLKQNYRESLLENSSQYSFIKNALENSDAKLKIIISHAPFISEKCIDCHSPLGGVFSLYHELFKNNDVKLVLSGHNHNYQRFNNEGITYIINGLGGRSHYQLDNESEGNFSEPFGITKLVLQNGTIQGQFVTQDDDQSKDFFLIKMVS